MSRHPATDVPRGVMLLADVTMGTCNKWRGRQSEGRATLPPESESRGVRATLDLGGVAGSLFTTVGANLQSMRRQHEAWGHVPGMQQPLHPLINRLLSKLLAHTRSCNREPYDSEATFVATCD